MFIYGVYTNYYPEYVKPNQCGQGFFCGRPNKSKTCSTGQYVSPPQLCIK